MAAPNTVSPITAALDAQVRQAWLAKRLSDGTKLNLGDVELEQTFKVTPMGTQIVQPDETGHYRCTDGAEGPYAKINFTKISPHAGGHTHPEGKYGRISSLPGREDGRMAIVTGQPAYIISKSRALVIERNDALFTVRVIAGSKLTRQEKKDLALTTQRWSLNGSGSGGKCTYVPD